MGKEGGVDGADSPQSGMEGDVSHATGARFKKRSLLAIELDIWKFGNRYRTAPLLKSIALYPLILIIRTCVVFPVGMVRPSSEASPANLTLEGRGSFISRTPSIPVV